MMYTKNERNYIYSEALTEFLNALSSGICIGLCCCIGKAEKRLNGKTIEFVNHPLENFPEVIKHEPKQWEEFCYWFHTDLKGAEKRIEILKQAIKETE